ncbi:TPA: YopX family protein [Enterococcus faecalis]
MIPKFRAWDKNTNDMVDVKTIDLEKDGSIGCIVDYNGINLDVSECVLMQYTGLKDKNGVEIFEGDILVYDAPKKYAHRRSMHEIAYADGRFFWEFLDLVFCQSNILYRDGYLVIGNIHENPELLEVAE